jgi:tetratricopeptide (TPR) repeat protein
VYAGGAREEPNRLQQAEQLIEERRYNEAMSLLSEVMKREPEKFDRAEELMEKIREAREEYNQSYEELLKVLNVETGEQLDEQRAYQIIQRLEELDANPNPASVEAFAQARRSIVFTVNNQEFERIMREANARLDEGAWNEAIDLYLSGFSLHRELFQEAGYGNLQSDRIEAQKQTIRDAVARFRELYDRLQEGIDGAVDAAVNAEAPLEEERVQEMLNVQREALDAWEAVTEAGSTLENLRQDLLPEDESDIPYLSTLRILSRGRQRHETANGISGAMERAVYRHYRELRSTARESYRELFNTGREAYFAGEFEESSADLSRASNHAAALREINNLWLSHLDRVAAVELRPKTGPSREALRSSGLYASAVQGAVEAYLELPEIVRALQDAKEQADTAEEIPAIREARSALRETQNRVTEIRAAVEEEIGSVRSELGGQAGSPAESGQADDAETAREEATRTEVAGAAEQEEEANPLQVLVSVRDELDRRLEELRAEEAQFLTKIATMEYQPYRKDLVQVRQNLDTARSYVEGVEEQIIEDAEPLTVRYPRRSQELVDQSTELLDEAQGGIDSMLEELGEKREYLLEREPVQEAQQEGENLLDTVAEQRSSAQEIAARAQELNRQADLALERGNLRFQEAQAQLQQNNFEQARQKLEQASNAYSESLNYREDPQVRDRIDEDLPELAQRILDRQNQLIVQQVRELINQGKELFFQENFIEAEKVLQRAQSRWRLTHPEDDPEINIWLERVQRALETTSGVRIATTDPLYPDMMQVLNLARQDYRRGVELYEEGNEEEAMERFNAAEKKIEYVKEPFPNNQEAGVLYLRILQYTSPQDFNTIFSNRFSEAKEKLDTVPEEAYRELQVLKEIKPDYQGMDEAIRQAEIATGIRQPPPDPEKLARARELYQQAEEIVEEDVRARFPVAITYLNEALKLNPDYQNAIVLKDRIQAGQGGQVRVVLDSVDQQKLQRAENLFIESRYYEASAIVNQLYQDPENRKNPKLIELKRRIESKL